MNIIAHNMYAMNAQRQFGINTKNRTKTTEKLSSGYKINRAADDAAGLAISEKLRRQIRGLKQGAENTMDGISWVQIGDGAMNEIHDMVDRLIELSVKAANGTCTDEDRVMIDLEIQELKKEINTVGKNTTFNELHIFDNDFVYMDIAGTPKDLQIFNSRYDDVTGEVEFGGIVFHGERITWDTVSPGMVEVEPVTNEQIFKEGDYTYTTSGGYTISFHCEDGSKVPDITRTIDVSADASGIRIDGELFSWDKVVDEEGKPCSANNVHDGGWGLDYHGAKVNFCIPYEVSSIQELADAIDSTNNGKVNYIWETVFTNNTPEQAVDMELIRNIQISDKLAEELVKTSDYSIVVRADENGIYLQNSNGDIIPDSEKTWQDMGINAWDEGKDISDTKTYTYYSDVSVDKPYLSFDFSLSNVTSLDSVIDGLDGVTIRNMGFKTNYETAVEVDMSANTNILQVQSEANNKVTFEDEVALGRVFDVQQMEVADSQVEYVEANGVDSTEDTVKLVYNDSNGSEVIALEGNVEATKKQLTDDVKEYLSYVEEKKIAAILAGKDPEAEKFGYTSLIDAVGQDNVTTSGYFDEVVAIDSNMKLTDGSASYNPGTVGKTYPTAYIDFKDFINEAGIMQLVGTGFDSTCKTCTNHYSVVFTSGTAYDNSTQDGFGYNMKKQGWNDYLLQIDLDSLTANGVTDGEKLASALVDITQECFDFHYTQYASEGSKLYVYDNRASSTGTQQATFGTKPYNDMSEGFIDIKMKSDEGSQINISYTYDFADAAKNIQVNMAESDSGKYVQRADGAYELYEDGVTDPAEKRYDVNVTYLKGGDLQAEAEAYATDAIKSVLNVTSVGLNAKDYTYMNLDGNEKNNVAIRADFESELTMTDYESGIFIQHSGNVNDFSKIPRFAMNTVAMGLFSANAKTQESALKTIDQTKEALKYVSEKRSIYGAVQNRLEHTYNANQNTIENTTAAESAIRDADMAKEVMKFSKEGILEQVSQAMMAQANQSHQGVLRLLE